MYLTMAIIGIILIIVGYLMPYKNKVLDYSTAERPEAGGIHEPSNIDDFSIELLKKQYELINYRFDTLSEKILKLENKAASNESTMSLDSDFKSQVYADSSVQQDKNTGTYHEEAHDNPKDINSTIYNMYDNGASLDEISSALRIGRGELQLRLGLRKTQKN